MRCCIVSILSLRILPQLTSPVPTSKPGLLLTVLSVRLACDHRGYDGTIVGWCDACSSCTPGEGGCPSHLPTPPGIAPIPNPLKVSPTARVLFQVKSQDSVENATLQWQAWQLLADCHEDPLEEELDFSPGGVLASVSNARNLIFAPGRLVPGGMYRLRLTARGAVATSTAEMRFTVVRKQ